MEKANEAAGGHNHWWRRPVHNSHLKSELSSPPVQGPFLVAMVMSKNITYSWKLGLFLLAAVTLFGEAAGPGPPDFPDARLPESPFIYHPSSSPNELTVCPVLMLSQNSTQPWRGTHKTTCYSVLISYYCFICCDLYYYNDISMRRGSCQWEVMFVQPIVTQDFVPFGHTLTFTLSFSIAKKFKAFPMIWLL